MDMRKSYPSDISREQFEEIREELAKAKKATHPRKYDLYDIFCAILYLLKEGCTWRAIPHDFPKWQNVRYHYDIWASPDEDGVSILEGVNFIYTTSRTGNQFPFPVPRTILFHVPFISQGR